MLRQLFAASLLFVATPALACDGHSKCTDCGAATTATADAATANTPPADATGTRGSLSLTGMKCGKCSDKVTAALTGVDGVNWVFVDHEKGLADVMIDTDRTSLAALTDVVKGLGFEAALVN